MSVILSVNGISDHEIAYNPAVIIQEHRKIIAVRVENKYSDWQNPEQYDPHIMFFRRIGNTLRLLPDTPVFVKYEDPWATWITPASGPPQLLFGAVWVDLSAGLPVITTRLFLSPNVARLDPYSPFAEIRGMKDIRVCQLPDGRYAVFTRPVIENMFFGRIGFVIVDDIFEINEAVARAQLLKLDIDSADKVGPNEVYYESGVIKVICHIATMDTGGSLHYSANRFIVDPSRPFDTQIHLTQLCTRSDFPPAPAKTPLLTDVVFPGGTGGVGQSELYCGLSDSAVGVFNLN